MKTFFTKHHEGKVLPGFLLAMLILLAANTQAQYFPSSTYQFNILGGNFCGGVSGNGIPATSSCVNAPYGLALDPFGNIWFAEQNGNTVNEITQAGNIYVIAGTSNSLPNYFDDGLAADAIFSSPAGVATDAAGNIYVADAGNGIIREISMDDINITTVAGVAGVQSYNNDGIPATSAYLNNPTGIAIDPAGNMYIADSYNDIIRMIPASDGTYFGQSMTAGNIYTIAGTPDVSLTGPFSGNPPANTYGSGDLATIAQFTNPTAVAVDGQGNLYFSNTPYGGNYGTGIYMVPVSDGTYWGQAMTANNEYIIIGLQGAYNYIGDGQPVGSLNLGAVTDVNSIAFDASGNMYFTDYAGSGDPYSNPFPAAKVRTISASTGIVNTILGYPGVHSLPTSASSGWTAIMPFPFGCIPITGPRGIAVDANGDVFVADSGDNVIEELVPYANTITISSITDINDNPVTNATPLCPGANLNIAFTVPPPALSPSNFDSLQLSDASGSFANPVTLGVIQGITGSGLFPADYDPLQPFSEIFIPTNTPAGTHYRVRVVSSWPVITGADNGFDITVSVTTPTSISITANPGNTITAGTSVTFTAAGVNGGATPGIDWSVNNHGVANDISTYTSNTFANGDQISAQMYSSASCPNPQPASSNRITMIVECSGAGGNAVATGGSTLEPNTVICSGNTTTLTLTNYSGTIQWQSSADGETGWADVAGGSGATTATYTTATLTSNTYYRAETQNCFTASSNTVLVSVLPATPALTVTLTNQTSTSIVASWTPNAANSNDIFNITWTGTGGGSANGVNSPYVIASGVTPGDPYTVTVNEVISGCNATGTANINALCAAPTLSLSNPIIKGFTATWNNTGATTYRLYFKLSTVPNYSFVDVTGTTYTFTSLYTNAEYLCYVAAENCPVPGQFGVSSVEQYITTLPNTSPCAVPVVGATSSCANQITITLSGSPTNNYFVIFGRISPNPSASVGYGITGIPGTTTVNINVGIQNAASTWQVYAESNCGGALTLPCIPVYVTIKPTCDQLQNLVLSTPNCDGFIGTWNADNCSDNLVSYYLYVKKSSAIGYNAYPVGTNNYIDATWLGPNTYDAYVASESCNKAISQASAVQTITTGIGCGRAEETAADNNPATEDNNQKVVMNVYPNPTGGNFMVNVYTKGSSDENIKIEMTNTLGQVVLTLITPVTNGISNNAFQMPENVSAGIYFIHTIVNGENLSQRVMYTK